MTYDDGIDSEANRVNEWRKAHKGDYELGPGPNGYPDTKGGPCCGNCIHEYRDPFNILSSCCYSLDYPDGNQWVNGSVICPKWEPKEWYKERYEEWCKRRVIG